MGVQATVTNHLSDQPRSRQLVDVSHLVSVVPVIRDWSQSNFGNVVPLNHRILKERFYSQIPLFNIQGGLQMSAVETSSGAQPQIEVMKHAANPLKNMRDIDVTLDSGIPVRLLIRGPFAVGTKPNSYDDLKFQLKRMIEASGGQSGREVILKLFEAQNDPKEHVDSLRAIEELRNEGYNVSLELAECYTANKVYSLDYYGETAKSLISTALEYAPTALNAVGLKDMIGGMKGKGSAEADWDNAGDLVNCFLKEIESALPEDKAKEKNLTIAIHCHDTGFSTEANVEAAIAAVERGYKIRLDTIPDGQGFSSIQAVAEELKKRGYDCGLTNDQMESLNEMAAAQNELTEKYQVAKIDDNLVSPDDAREMNMPGGAKPSFVLGVINPLVSLFKEAANTVFNSAKEKYISLWERLGFPHAVTPGANNLGALTCITLANEHKGDEEFSDLPFDQINYWRGQMPSDVAPDVLNEICKQHLKKELPNILAGDNFKGLRDKIIANPTNKENAQKLIDESNVELSAEVVESIIDAVGVRTKSLSHGLPVLQDTLRNKVEEELFKKNGIVANEDDVLDYTWMALNRGSGDNIHPDVIKVFEVEHSVKNHHVPNPEGKNAEQWALDQAGKTKEELAAEVLEARMKELTDNAHLAMQ